MIGNALVGMSGKPPAFAVAHNHNEIRLRGLPLERARPCPRRSNAPSVKSSSPLPVRQSVRRIGHRSFPHRLESNMRGVADCAGDTADIRSTTPFLNKARNYSCNTSGVLLFCIPSKQLLDRLTEFGHRPRVAPNDG